MAPILQAVLCIMLLHLLGIVSLLLTRTEGRTMPITESRLAGAGLIRLERRRPLTLCCPIGDFQCVATTKSPLPAPGTDFDLSGRNILDIDTDAGRRGFIEKLPALNICCPPGPYICEKVNPAGGYRLSAGSSAVADDHTVEGTEGPGGTKWPGGRR